MDQLNYWAIADREVEIQNPITDRKLRLLDDYAHDLDDTPSVQACKRLAVKMARLGDEDSTLLALQHAAAHVGGYAEQTKGR